MAHLECRPEIRSLIASSLLEKLLGLDNCIVATLSLSFLWDVNMRGQGYVLSARELCFGGGKARMICESVSIGWLKVPPSVLMNELILK